MSITFANFFEICLTICGINSVYYIYRGFFIWKNITIIYVFVINYIKIILLGKI